MHVSKTEILTLLKRQGKFDEVGQAEAELPSRVDTDEHGQILRAYGLSTDDLHSSSGSAGSDQSGSILGDG